MPERSTSTAIIAPSCWLPTTRCRSSDVSMSRPAALTTMSPVCMPPAWAGPSASTEVTRAPRGRSRPKARASSLVTACVLTPIRPRTIGRPVLRSSAIRMARSIGMAKDSPWKPPERVQMRLLMPITLPCALNSGPPELPGLTAASVWMNGTSRSSTLRDLAETMPAVTLCSKPKGEPMAATGSPTRTAAGLPIATVGRPTSVHLQERRRRSSRPRRRYGPAARACP